MEMRLDLRCFFITSYTEVQGSILLSPLEVTGAAFLLCIMSDYFIARQGGNKDHQTSPAFPPPCSTFLPHVLLKKIPQSPQNRPKLMPNLTELIRTLLSFEMTPSI